MKQNKYISENGHLNDESISLYIDAILLDKINALPVEIINHVEDCTECKQTILQGYEALKEINLSGSEAHPFFDKKTISIKKTNFSIFYKIAASFVFIISVSLMVYYTSINKSIINENYSENILPKNNNDSLTKELQTNKDSLPQKQIQEIKPTSSEPEKELEVKNQIAKNDLKGEEFQVSPIMLSMIGNITRSDYFKVVEPKDSVIFAPSEKIKFTWETDIEEELTLKIFNYKDILVFESKLLEPKEYIFENTLAPGAYIWKIESEDALYHLGLLFVTE